MPWIGITGSAAAAVAVVIVVVVLFRNQKEWVRAPRPAVLGEPGAGSAPPSVPAEGSAAATGQVAGDAKSSANARRADAARAKSEIAKKQDLAKRNERLAATGQVKAQTETKGMRAPAGLRDEAASSETSQKTMERKLLSARESAPAPSASVPEAQPLSQDAARVQGLAQNQAQNAYANVLRAYRLPPLWNGSVSPDAVRRAEADLRYLYQMGKAGPDSGRVRLYLAEAERARLGDPSNTEAVESISHHYRRAISLAGGDAALLATARQRLADFEQEIIRTRGTPPPPAAR